MSRVVRALERHNHTAAILPLRIRAERLRISSGAQAPKTLEISGSDDRPRENEGGHGQQREGEDSLQMWAGKPLS